MFAESLQKVAVSVGGQLLLGDASLAVRGVFNDSRRPRRGGLFVALQGERFDGHAFLDAARRGGAAAVLISDATALEGLDAFSPQSTVGEGRTVGTVGAVGAVLVKDTRAAYLRLAEAHRQSEKLAAVRWFAVTGSAGKTSVKEMLAHVLSEGAGWTVRRAPKSFNNEIGVPATILSVGARTRGAVLELGASQPGEIARLAAVARPHVALITNAGPTHLEAFHTVEGVAEEKAHVLDFQDANAVAVLNAGDPNLERWRARAPGRVLTFGLREQAGLRGMDLAPAPGGAGGISFTACFEGRQAQVRLKVPGRHNVLNALAAMAAALSAGVELGAAAESLGGFAGAKRRFQRLDVNGVTVVDDAYNASPLSFQAALEALQSHAARRVFIVAGEMRELGDAAETYHDALGGMLAAAKPRGLFTVGALAGRAGQAAVRAGLPKEAWRPCASPEEAAEDLAPRLRRGDLVLVKGSRATRLERCIARLLDGACANAR